MIAAALTSPCLIRSDGRTITIEPLRVVPFSHDVGVAGIPLRHAPYSGTDLEQGRVAPSQSPSAVPTARHPNSNVQPQTGRTSWRERVCQKVYISVVPVPLKKKQTIDI